MQFAYGRNDATNLLVTEAQGIGDRFFGHLQRAGLDHHNRVFTSRDDDIEQTRFLLGHGGIGHQLALEQSHAHCSNRFVKG